MIDAALIDLLDGPTPAVLTPHEARRRWSKHKLAVEKFTTTLRAPCSSSRQRVSQRPRRRSHCVKLSLVTLEALTNPQYGMRDPGAGYSIPRAQEHKRRAA